MPYKEHMTYSHNALQASHSHPELLFRCYHVSFHQNEQGLSVRLCLIVRVFAQYFLLCLLNGQSSLCLMNVNVKYTTYIWNLIKIISLHKLIRDDWSLPDENLSSGGCLRCSRLVNFSTLFLPRSTDMRPAMIKE